MGINIGEYFFQIFGEQNHILGFVGRFCHIFHFFCVTNSLIQKLLFYFIF